MPGCVDLNEDCSHQLKQFQMAAEKADETLALELKQACTAIYCYLLSLSLSFSLSLLSLLSLSLSVCVLCWLLSLSSSLFTCSNTGNNKNTRDINRSLLYSALEPPSLNIIQQSTYPPWLRGGQAVGGCRGSAKTYDKKVVFWYTSAVY